MSESRSFPRIFLWGFAIVIILAAVAAYVIRQANQSRADIPVHGTVPAFEFVNQDGEPYGSEELQGKITILDFIFTNCEGACPVMSRAMSGLYEDFSNTDRVQFVSISVDPARDSLAALRKYAKRYEVTDDRWNFLRTEIDSVKWLAREGFSLSDEFPMGHSTRFVLIDRNLRIRGYYRSDDDASIGVLKRHIRELAREG